MKCLRCQHENPATAKFCEECAAPLTPACPSCGSQVSPTAKFCPDCAHPLKSLTGHPRFASPESYTPKHLAEKILTSRGALEGERKHVTVLFADLKGSMELLADRDPEEARKLLDSVLALMMEAVHHFEGMVNEARGDGIMALFGAPLAHEDHAIRACYAALRMQEAVNRHADEVRRREGVLVQIRVGINSGEVVVRSMGSDLRMEYSAIGRTTHMAARMEQLAAPGTIQVTGETLRLVEDFVHVTALGPVPVKGLVEPVEVFELMGAGTARTRFQAAARRGLTRFVGRNAELEQLRDALDRASQGRGQVVAVVGDPGVGKSRLFWEFTHSHRLQSWLVLESASVSYGKATAYLPVIELLRGYFELESRDDLRKIRERVTGKLLTLDESLKPVLSGLLALLDVPVDDVQWKAVDPPERRRRTLDAVRQLLLREACEQPVLLVFEDLHWIDGETQTLLDSLVESLPAARLLLLVNYRPEYSHAWGSKTYYRQLRIDPLPPESAGELLDSLLGTDVALGSLKQLLLERTEANPLFLEESVRALAETDVLSGKRGAYRLTRPVEQLKMPATVQAILAARIDSLAIEAKRLLQAAAVIGKDVPLGLLLAIADMPEHEVRTELAHLQAAEFLYEFRLFPDIEYTFKHALTHEVAYFGLLQKQRRELHTRIVDAIERLYRDRLPKQVERLAHHAVRGEVWEKALLYTRQAAQRAAVRSAHREAIASFNQALVALSKLPNYREISEQAIDIRLELRSSLFTVGDLPRILEVLEEADTIAAGIGDIRRRAMALTFLANQYFEMARLERAGTYADRALNIASGLGDPSLEAIGRMHQGRILYSRGDYRAAIDLLESAAAVLREHTLQPSLGAHSTGILACLPFLVRALVEVGEFEKAVELGKDGLQICIAVSDAFGLVHSHFALGFAHLRQGDIDQALPELETGLDLARTKSVSFLEPLMCAAVGSAYAQSDRIAEALPLLEAGVHGAEQMGHPGFLGWLQCWLAEGYVLAERPADALATATLALEAARQAGRRGNEAHVLRILGDIAFFDSREAVRRYTESLDLATELGMRPVVAHCHARLGKVYRCTGEVLQAQQHLTNAASMYRAMGMRLWQRGTEAEIAALV
jgi:class 3 adenylate cyclase/tetratricopeptide (TPR) repeat protein